MGKIIRATELARIMELKPYFFRDRHYRRTRVGVMMRPDAAYYSEEYAKCLAKYYHKKSKVSLAEIMRRIDTYHP